MVDCQVSFVHSHGQTLITPCLDSYIFNTFRIAFTQNVSQGQICFLFHLWEQNIWDIVSHPALICARGSTGSFTKFLCQLVPDYISVDSRASDSIEFGVFPHETLKKLLLETDLGVWEVFEFVNENIRDDQSLAVTRLYKIRSRFMLSCFFLSKPELKKISNSTGYVEQTCLYPRSSSFWPSLKNSFLAACSRSPKRPGSMPSLGRPWNRRFDIVLCHTQLTIKVTATAVMIDVDDNILCSWC
jgi:hypothetical protein